MHEAIGLNFSELDWFQVFDTLLDLQQW
jgi:hypothetical protein